MKNTNKRFQISILLSVVIHVALALFLLLHPSLNLHDMHRKPVEVELMDPDKMAELMKKFDQNQGQIVSQDQRINDEKPKDSKYLSKYDQTVVQQTQAQTHARFKNTDNKSAVENQIKTPGQTEPQKEVAQRQAADQPTQVKEKTPKSHDIMTAEDGPEMKHTKPSLKDLTPSFRPTHQAAAQGGGDGLSATDDHLKDVAVGMQTLLSTREFVYYSYYNRIKEKLSQYWEPKIKEKVARIIRQGRTIASTGDKITRIVIILNDKGVLQRVQIVGASGVSDLDDAAVEAFRAAAPFPNPPKGIVESDGTIKIRWDFILEAQSGLFDGVGVASKIM